MLKRGKEVFLIVDNYFENVCLRILVEDEMSLKNEFLEGFEGNEDL